MKILALTLLLLLSGCDPSQRCPLTPSTYFFKNEVAARPVRPGYVTKKGIAVDLRGLESVAANELLRIDRLTDEVEACLQKTFPDGKLPPDVVERAACYGQTFTPKAPRACMTVRVIPDWFLSSVEYAGSKHQMIPGVVATGCTEKGMPPGDCYRRVGLINYRTIVTPPALYLYKEGALKLTTGCSFPWESPALAACMTPTTAPLDDGTGP